MPALDTQTVIVVLVVALAAAWWIRRAIKWASGDHSCGTGCESCGTSTPRTDGGLVELDVSNGHSRKN